jgi:hypothetical protein
MTHINVLKVECTLNVPKNMPPVCRSKILVQKKVPRWTIELDKL